jgi:hypothetical protein
MIGPKLIMNVVFALRIFSKYLSLGTLKGIY